MNGPIATHALLKKKVCFCIISAMQWFVVYNNKGVAPAYTS